MRYRLRTIAYVFALVAASMAAVGPWLGAVTAALVFKYWQWLFRTPPGQPVRRAAFYMAAAAVAGTLCISIALFSMCTMLDNLGAYHVGSRCDEQAPAIAQMLGSYRKQHASFPSLIVDDAAGRPQHSWRALVLPYVPVWLADVTGSAAQPSYDATQSWDSATNTEAVEDSVGIYACPAARLHHQTDAPLTAHFFRVHASDDPKEDAFAWPIVIEASSINATWTEPRDVSLDEAVQLLSSSTDAGHAEQYEGYFVTRRRAPPQRMLAWCDVRADGVQSHCLKVGQFRDPADALALLESLTDKEAVERILARQRQAGFKGAWKIGRIYGAVIFALVALMPGAVLWRTRVHQSKQPIDDARLSEHAVGPAEKR
ncbi:MAG: hypothetical protein CMJ58_06555 [Planctomycetaceae bacterium]|nr:hypothetical protein [Planctomycetaceae bacterium]